MHLKQINMPFLLKIDNGLIYNLEKLLYLKENNKKAIIGIDKHIKQIYGDIVILQLERIYKDIYIFEINSNELDVSFELANMAINYDFDTIIGIGGGKTLDVCKYSSYISKKVFVSIPTAIAHDGVASPIAVLKCKESVKSLGCDVPSAIIVDLNIIKDAPIILTKAGIGDTLSNYTAIKDWKLAKEVNNDEINDFSILLSELAVKSVINHCDKCLENMDFIKTVVESCIMSGIAMNIAGSSRPCSGSEHLISHSMDKLNKNIPHGIQVGISTIIATYLHGENPKNIKHFLEIFNIPTTLDEIGISFDEYLYIMKNAKNTRPGRYTILNEIDLSDENLKKIYENCFTNM